MGGMRISQVKMDKFAGEPCCTICISSPSQEGGETALMKAAEGGHRGLVEKLVRKGASVNVKNEV